MSKKTQSNETLDYVALAFEVGSCIGESNALENKAATFKATANNNIKALHLAKVKVGQYRKDGSGCAIATAFVDGCVKAGVAASTAQRVYLGTFKAHVASGKEVTDWNGSRKEKKSGGGKGKGKAAFADLMLKAFNHESGESLQTLCAEIEARFQNDDIGTIYDGFINYLESEGYEINQ